MDGLKDRVTVVETIYHQQVGEQPSSVETRFERRLESSEQPYQRRLSVGQTWLPLDCGWIEEVGMISIHNNEGRFLQTNPTDELRAKVAKKVLEVSYTSSSPSMDEWCHWRWLIPPGESMRGCPSHADKLFIRSQSGMARFTIHVFPR